MAEFTRKIGRCASICTSLLTLERLKISYHPSILMINLVHHNSFVHHEEIKPSHNRICHSTSRCDYGFVFWATFQRVEEPNGRETGYYPEIGISLGHA